MPRKTALVVAAILAVITAGAIAATSLGGDDPPSTPTISVGKALDFGKSWQFEGPMTRGQEVIDLYGYVRNTSDAAVTLEVIRPLEGNGVPENGEVLDLFLVPTNKIGGGLYHTLPPVIRERGKCVKLPVKPVSGYVLGPREDALIAMHIRATRLGTFHLKERDFFYEQSGRSYRQRDSSGYTGRVREKWGRELSYAERTCPGVKLLPQE